MKVVCPVCNRLFEAECSPYKESYNEIVYYFDTEMCLLAFRSEPGKFVFNCQGKKGVP
ncbi:hypothetical protein [Stygiolobus caldivivus]|uniref:YHS domain-containing protein n=1 Tax=Stygiolobus caldivivus TaxID=2824673 RepID=A0A8D5U4V0_9CREN|nr:hypothetical protein [Stygiolobus caldivivus]BCU69128.1 hypothetical protein KN1_04250 [Stygiolobus caldivivus]